MGLRDSRSSWHDKIDDRMSESCLSPTSSAETAPVSNCSFHTCPPFGFVS